MTDRSKLLALAEAVEKLTGPDNATDAAIFEAVYGFPEQAYQQRNGMRSKGSPPLDRMTWLTGWGVSAYTASLDAAMTLVRDGYGFQVDGFGDAWWSSLSEEEGFHGNAQTPALALTAASLRAQAEALA